MLPRRCCPARRSRSPRTARTPRSTHMTTNKFVAPKRLAATLALSLIGWMSGAQAAATIYILNGDGPGVGFNDATAVAPVGGNPGTTLGQQRLFEFQAAADKWGATLTSPVPIKVNATWEAL